MDESEPNRGRSRSTLVLKLLAEFVDLAKVDETLSKVEDDDLGDRGRREIMETFCRQYRVFKEGKDPDSPWAHMELDWHPPKCLKTSYRRSESGNQIALAGSLIPRTDRISPVAFF